LLHRLPFKCVTFERETGGRRHAFMRTENPDIPIEQRASFEALRYANCWEDGVVPVEALKPEPGQQILSIASAGDNSLALLASGAEVLAVDLSPAQLASTELRREAISNLSYADCLAFLGINAFSDRWEIYLSLRHGLSTGSRAYWDRRPRAVEKGVIHAGKFERYFHLFRKWVLPLAHPRTRVRELLEKKNRDARLAFYHEIWANRRWNWMFRVFFSRRVMGRMGRDPEFFRYVEVPVAQSISARVEYALTELETHSNPFLRYILTGNFGGNPPPYLKKDLFERIRANLGALSLYCGPVEEAVRRSGRRFSGFNLSDIFEYLDEASCREIQEVLLDHSVSGARFVYWNMLVPRRIHDSFSDRVHPLRELSENLFLRDRAFFYSRLIVEQVQ